VAKRTGVGQTSRLADGLEGDVAVALRAEIVEADRRLVGRIATADVACAAAFGRRLQTDTVTAG